MFIRQWAFRFWSSCSTFWPVTPGNEKRRPGGKSRLN